MSEEIRLVTDFYTAFQRLEGDRMAEFYGPDARFCDAAFGDLQGDEIGDMWRMLCGGSKDLKVVFSIKRQRDNIVDVEWVARYTFSKTSRPVVNEVSSQLTIVDGKIQNQVDQFDFATWAAQALGFMGRCFGWSGLLRSSVQRSARSSLGEFRRRRGRQHRRHQEQ